MHLVHGSFATSTDAMRQHSPTCKSMATKDKDGDEDDGYLLEEI